MVDILKTHLSFISFSHLLYTLWFLLNSTAYFVREPGYCLCGKKKRQDGDVPILFTLKFFLFLRIRKQIAVMLLRYNLICW